MPRAVSAAPGRYVMTPATVPAALPGDKGLRKEASRSSGRRASSCATAWNLDEDVDAALDWLATRRDVEPRRIGLLGVSLGAEVALRVAPRRRDVRAIAAERFHGAARAMCGRRFAPVPSPHRRETTRRSGRVRAARSWRSMCVRLRPSGSTRRSISTRVLARTHGTDGVFWRHG